MGFTTPETNNRLIASIILKDDQGKLDVPAFYKREKDEATGKWLPTENLGTVVDGQFKKIELKTIGDLVLIEITLEDNDGEYVVSGSWTQIMRNIVNSLAGSAGKLGTVTIGLYEKAGKDGKMYPKVWVKNNGEKTEWKIGLDEQENLKDEMEFKGKKMVDWSKFETALIDCFDEINGEAISVDDELFGVDMGSAEVDAHIAEKKDIKKPKKKETEEFPNDELPF